MKISKNVQRWPDLDGKSLEDTVSFVESKKMAWDALSKEDTNDGVSSYKKEKANRKSTIKDNLQVLKSRN